MLYLTYTDLHVDIIWDVSVFVSSTIIFIKFLKRYKREPQPALDSEILIDILLGFANHFTAIFIKKSFSTIKQIMYVYSSADTHEVAQAVSKRAVHVIFMITFVIYFILS